MNINIKLFDSLYGDLELPFKQVAGLMDIAVSTLYVNVTGRYGRKLRTTSEANLVAMKRGRWHYPNPPYEVDWEKFKNRHYSEDKTLTEMIDEFPYTFPQSLGRAARRNGFKILKRKN